MTTADHAPSLEMVRRLQLFRTTLINFLTMRNFAEVVMGCYVRVLLEMHSAGTRRENSDSYYIAYVKGAQLGPTYTGFSADGASTQWHIVIELPLCFRSAPNSNVVQLNSISNSPFRQSEYDNWVEMIAHAQGHHFPSAPQLLFRLGMLEEHKQQAITPSPRRTRNGEDAQTAARREQLLAERRTRIEREVLQAHLRLPLVDQLRHVSVDELQEMEREILDLATRVRMLINERSKCTLCRSRVCTEICYPCKHQVLCKGCASRIDKKCPVPGCTVPVQMIFEPFSS